MKKLRKGIIYSRIGMIIILAGLILYQCTGSLSGWYIAIGTGVFFQFIFMCLSNCPHCGDWLFVGGPKAQFNAWALLLGVSEINCSHCEKKILIKGKSTARHIDNSKHEDD